MGKCKKAITCSLINSLLVTTTCVSKVIGEGSSKSSQFKY